MYCSPISSPSKFCEIAVPTFHPFTFTLRSEDSFCGQFKPHPPSSTNSWKISIAAVFSDSTEKPWEISIKGQYAWIETKSNSANSRKKRRSTIAVAESQSMEHSRPARRKQRQSAAQRASSSKTTTPPLLPSKSHTARRKPAGTAISRHAIELIIRNTWSCLLTNKTPRRSLILWKD